jgi:hypothetical protein
MHFSSLPSVIYAPHPHHPQWVYDPNNIWLGIQVINLLIMQFCPASCYFFPNIPLSALFSNTLSPCSSYSITDQVSQPYKTTGKNHNLVFNREELFLWFSIMCFKFCSHFAAF